MLRRLTMRKGSTTAGTVKKVTTRTSANLTPAEIQTLIKTRAYEIYCRRGCKVGDHVSDWLKAEKQVREELRLS